MHTLTAPSVALSQSQKQKAACPCPLYSYSKEKEDFVCQMSSVCKGCTQLTI